MPSISCSNLTFRWPDGAEVLSGVDLSPGPGRVGVVGTNGGGKTTLLRLVASHALPFLRAIGTDRWLHLDAGGLTEELRRHAHGTSSTGGS